MVMFVLYGVMWVYRHLRSLLFNLSWDSAIALKKYHDVNGMWKTIKETSFYNTISKTTSICSVIKEPVVVASSMYFFIKLQLVCFLTLLLLIAELTLDHFTHSLTLLVVAWQTLYNFLSLFISSVSLALINNNSRALKQRVIHLIY